ncbi:MAG TPA: hypothetical protein VFO95_15425 [Gemmatimonadales bacterium]|nr:hypothetical protein [Gemmatimonadales bacterium]
MKTSNWTRLVVLGLVLALAGFGLGDRPPRPASRPTRVPAPLSLAVLDDALNRVLPQLSAPGLPALIVAVRDLATALGTPGRPGLSRAVDRAREALAAFEAGPGRYYAIDLDLVRLAIGVAGSLE